MQKFIFTPTTISEVVVIVPRIFEDNRGFFTEVYNKKEFLEFGINENFVQDNFSFSKKDVIRGLHFSKTPGETAKLVRCLKGKIFDVAVDIRPDSKTFGKWVGETLSAENRKMFFVPRGFAHGFCSMTPEVEVSYKVTDYYSPENDLGIIYNDPDFGIKWPIENPILSEKDKNLPTYKSLFK